jgi:uncharacterized protein (TIRG00374 family)
VLLFRAVTDLRSARGEFVAAAVLAEGAALVAFVELHRGLLRVGGHRMRFRSVFAVVISGNAVAAAVPMVGGEAGMSYSYHRYRAAGASPSVAGWVLALSGVLSTFTFITLCSVAAVLSGHRGVALGGIIGGGFIFVGVGVLGAALRSDHVRAVIARASAVGAVWVVRLLRRPSVDVERGVLGFFDQLATLRLRTRDWPMTVFWALHNWLFDALCFALAVRSFDPHIPPSRLVFAWSLGSGASTISPTPGGLGVVEATIAATLTTAGVPPARALAAALLYRLINFWGAAAAGWITVFCTPARPAATLEPVRTGAPELAFATLATGASGGNIAPLRTAAGTRVTAGIGRSTPGVLVDRPHVGAGGADRAFGAPLPIPQEVA